jgi:hypothetical protein
MKQQKNTGIFCLVIGTDRIFYLRRHQKHFWLWQLCLCYYKNEPLMVNFKFAKFHCYQQIQSFLIIPY